jgi:hypothetical protein
MSRVFIQDASKPFSGVGQICKVNAFFFQALELLPDQVFKQILYAG